MTPFYQLELPLAMNGSSLRKLRIFENFEYLRDAMRRVSRSRGTGRVGERAAECDAAPVTARVNGSSVRVAPCLLQYYPTIGPVWVTTRA